MSNKIVTRIRRALCICGSGKRVHLIDKETLEMYCETCEVHHGNTDMLLHMSPVYAPDDADEQLLDYQYPWVVNRLGKTVSLRMQPKDLRLLAEAMQHYKTTSPVFAVSEMLYEKFGKVKSSKPKKKPESTVMPEEDDGVLRL